MILYTSALDAWCKAALKGRAVTPRRIVCSYATKEEWPTTQHSPAQSQTKENPLTLRWRVRRSIVAQQWYSGPFGFGPLYCISRRVEGSLYVTHIPDTGPHFFKRVVGSREQRDTFGSLAFCPLVHSQFYWLHVILQCKKNPEPVTLRVSTKFRS